jgi:hypothetical protein
MAPAEGVSMPKAEALALSPVVEVPSVFWAIAAPVSPKAEPSATICTQCLAVMFPLLRKRE